MKGKIFFVLTVFFIVFSMWPTVYEARLQDTIRENRYFELVHNFYTDFNFYLSRIRLGLEGNLTVVEKYTSEPHQGSFIHVLYLGLGWVGRFTRVPWHRTSDIYHVSRIVFAFVLLWMMVEIARRSFSRFRWQIIAFLMAVTASTWPKIVPMDDGGTRIGGYMPWWSVMDSLQRITFIPHLVVGQALIAFILYAGSSTDTMKKPANWIFVGILAFFLGIIFPPGYVFVVAALGVMVVMEFAFDFKSALGRKFIPWMLTHALPRAVVVFMGVPAALYLQLMVTFFPWKQLTLADIIHPLPFRYPEYLQAMGPILPLGILGGIWAVTRRERTMMLSVSWVVAWALLLIVFNFIPQQSPLRFSEMIPHLPLAILGTYLFVRLASKLAVKQNYFPPAYSLQAYQNLIGSVNKPFDKKVIELVRLFTENTSKAVQTFRSGLNKIMRREPPIKILALTVVYLMPLAFITMELFHMHSSWLWQRDFVDHKIRAMYPLVPTGSYVMYPLKDFVNAIRWLQDNTTRDTVILSETTTGNYIPVYSGNTVYVGHENTVSWQEKQLYVKSFYSANMPYEQAYKFLKEEKLQYIFFGPQEKEDGGFSELLSIYPFLQEAYRNDNVIIYTVK